MTGIKCKKCGKEVKKDDCSPTAYSWKLCQDCWLKQLNTTPERNENGDIIDEDWIEVNR